MSRLTIVGMGYIGTSIGLALKERKGNLEIVGHDREHSRALAAKKLGAIDRAEWNLPAALERAAMVVVATPLNVMETLFGQMAEFVEPGAIVTDTASLKSPTFAWAEAAFGDRVSFVGGDPIVTPADEARAPSATLFQDRTYCVIAAPKASTEAVEQVVRFVQALGARPLFIDPVEHDSHLAAVGQLPTLLASALMNVVTSNPAWRDGQRLAGPAFRAITALATQDPVEQRAQLVLNRALLSTWIARMRDELGELGRLLEEDAHGLQKALDTAQAARSAWRPGVEPSDDLPSPDLPSARQQFSSWFLGGFGSRRKP